MQFRLHLRGVEILREEFAEETGSFWFGFGGRACGVRSRCGGVRGFRRWFGPAAFEEFVELEEFAAEGVAVGGPFVVAGGAGQGYADGSELGVEIVEIVEDHGFANHGELGGTELVLAVVRDEQVLHDGF